MNARRRATATSVPAVPRKRFGQHFLSDPVFVSKIIDAFDPHPGENILEIGPGLGALTRELLRRARRVQAIEIDRDLIPRLRAECGPIGELNVYTADALRFDYCSQTVGDRKLRLIGNLPYNISTPLLFYLLDQAKCIEDMLFMLQKEVVDRVVAAPGSKDYGRLSVMIQWRCRAQRLFHVPPGAFRPPPKVESAVVRLVPRPEPGVAVRNPASFARVVQSAFAQRRKTLRNSLRGILDARAISALGIDPTRRPETLEIREFAALADALEQESH